MVKNIHAQHVAEWFLNKNNYVGSITDTECITNMKLQKLLYYAQGNFLKKYNIPLFSEKIYAWQHGPVVIEVYEKYKKFGANSIEFNGNSELQFDDHIESFLESIYEEYGQYSAWKLREMTHSESPWDNTSLTKEITIDSMKKFFQGCKL